jgi:hypothetical protein
MIAMTTAAGTPLSPLPYQPLVATALWLRKRHRVKVGMLPTGMLAQPLMMWSPPLRRQHSLTYFLEN